MWDREERKNSEGRNATTQRKRIIIKKVRRGKDSCLARKTSKQCKKNACPRLVLTEKGVRKEPNGGASDKVSGRWGLGRKKN